MKNTKAIILAGGSGTRLHPITKINSKHLLPIYNKPLIFYPLSLVILLGIKDILIITNKEHLSSFKKVLGNGIKLGIRIEYKIQNKPSGIAESLIIGKNFIKQSRCLLILGDNIFFGNNLISNIKRGLDSKKSCILFCLQTKNPERYGVFDLRNKKKIKIVEKPKEYISNWVAPGIYIYDQNASKIASSLKPSKRNELEITDLNNIYLAKNNYEIIKMGRGVCWFDAGTFDSLLSASFFVKTIEDRLGEQIGNIYEASFKSKRIKKKQYLNLISKLS